MSDTRSEVLAGAFLPFARRFLQQTFKCSALDIDIHRRPIFLVDHCDDALEIYRIVEARCCLRENVAQQSACFAKFSEYVCVMIS